MNKNLKKALVFFVTFLFTAQSFLPIMALAENEKVTGVLLETFKVISESEEEIATEITAHVTNVTEVDEKFEILLNEGIAATVSSTSGAVQEDVAIENGNKLLINSRAQSQSALKIKLSIRRDSVEGLSELSASTISQKITVPLEMKKYEIESSDISEMDTSTTASSEEKEIVKEQPVVKQQMQRNVVDQPSSLEMILELNGSKFNGIPIINENDTFTFRLGYQAGSTDLIGKTVPIIFPEELELPDSILKVPAGNENIESITRDPNNPQKINIKFKDSTINSNGEFTISGKYHLTQKEKNEERHLSWSLDGDEGTVTIIEKVPGSKIPSTNYKNRTKKNVENGNKYAITQDEKGKVTITENKQANVKYKLNWETAEGVTGGTITDEIDSRWNINSDVSKIKAKVTTTTVMDELNEVTETKEYPLDASNIVIVDNKLTLTNINLPANSKLELNYTAFMTESGKEELIKEAEKELETKDQGNYVVKNIAKFNDKEETGQFSIGYSKATKPGVIDPNQENTWDIINKTVDQDFMKHRLTDDGYFIDEADKPTTVDLNYQVDINLNKFKTEGTNALKENTVLVDILPTNIEYQISALNVMQGDKSIGKDVSSQYQEIHDGDMITELAKAPVFSYALKNGRLYVNVGKDKNQSYQLKMTLKVSRMINGQYVGKYNRPTWSIRNWAILHDGPNQYPTYVDTGIEKKETVTPPVKEDKAFKKNAKSNIQIEKGEAATIDYAFEINGWDKPISRMDDFELIDWVNLDYFDESELLNAKLSGELGWGERELADLLTLSLGDKNENNEQQLIIRPNDKFKELAAGFQDGKRMKINLSLKTKVFDKKVLLDIKNTATFNVKGHEEVYTSTKETEVNSFGDEMALDKQVASMDEQVFKKSLNLDMKEKNSDDIVVYQIKLLPNGGYTGAFGFEVIDELPKEIEFLGFVPENNLFTSLPTEKNKLSEIKLLDKSGKYQAVYDNNEIKISNSKGNNIQGKETSVYFYARVKSYEKDQPIINSLKNTDVEATVVPKVVSLPITKIWEDYDNHFNTRPDSIKVALLQNEKEFKEIELSGQDNEWTYNFTNLPQQDALGNDYRYTVQEIKVPENYTSKVEGTTITNTYVNKDTVEVPVTKIWEDYSNQFNTRPENITVELLKNGKSEVVQELTGDSDKWSYTFKDLPKYDNKGKEFSYSVKEIKVPSNYTSKVEGTTITNTYVNKETTELPVTKIWE
ncbi:Cna B-type domain-containing protein [Vagococcus sp.]|uniref:Cna B-type domain-containing protein n=1 Tax=Vagococcus sp. TaxID=1933889 RepID=UPI000ED899FB|nr:Cna B-type domain-containing protein [Vagococcus sp.]HCM89129.1 hypothetical protein [Vagococcus sp.]